MKKALCIFLTVICLLSVCIMPASAQNKEAKISVTINTDISGLDCYDYKEFAVINNDAIRFRDYENGFLQVNDYSGDVYFGKLKPGRKYNIDFSFSPKDGYTLPDEMNESNTEIICSENCDVYWYGITVGRDCEHFAEIHAEITVDGNFFQMLFGRIADWWIKIKAWSPY